MKRFWTVLLTAALCLTACGKDAPPPEASAAPPEAPAVTAPETPKAAPMSQPAAMEEPEPVTGWSGWPGVTLSLLQESYPVGVQEITLVIDNRSDGEICYGEHFSCQRFVDGTWQDVPFKDRVFFHDVAYCLQADSVWTLWLDMTLLEQTLEEGLYRLTGREVYLREAEGNTKEASEPWQLDFRVTADAQPEPDYALYISKEPVPTAEGCLVTDRLPVYLINHTGKEGQVLLIPHLERWNAAGEWEEVPYRENIGFCGTPDPLPIGGKAWSEDMLYLWGTLEDGRYRLSYEVGDTFDTEDRAYGEFTLYTPEASGLPLAPTE